MTLIWLDIRRSTLGEMHPSINSYLFQTTYYASIIIENAYLLRLALFTKDFRLSVIAVKMNVRTKCRTYPERVVCL
jgi:hypothetical protein